MFDIDFLKTFSAFLQYKCLRKLQHMSWHNTGIKHTPGLHDEYDNTKLQNKTWTLR